MKRNQGALSGYFALLASILLMSGCAAKLVNMDESLPKLNLTKEQREVVVPKMEAIKGMVDEYNAEKEQIDEELNNMRSGMGGGKGGMMGDSRGGREAGGGGGSGLREKLQEFRNKRETYLSAINVHIKDIKAVLDEEQLMAFEKMEMPKLEMPEMPMGRRGGRGGGRGGMGGRGGGGGRRGGGMF